MGWIERWPVAAATTTGSALPAPSGQSSTGQHIGRIGRVGASAVIQIDGGYITTDIYSTGTLEVVVMVASRTAEVPAAYTSLLGSLAFL